MLSWCRQRSCFQQGEFICPKSFYNYLSVFYHSAFKVFVASPSKHSDRYRSEYIFCPSQGIFLVGKSTAPRIRFWSSLTAHWAKNQLAVLLMLIRGDIFRISPRRYCLLLSLLKVLWWLSTLILFMIVLLVHTVESICSIIDEPRSPIFIYARSSS